MDEQRLFSTKEAAEYLGVSTQTVYWHVRVKGDLIPDKRIGGRFLVFTQETLDAYREGREPDPAAACIYSSKEAAHYLGMTTDGLNWHVHRADNLKPDRKIAGRLVFTQATLDAFKHKKR